MSWPVAFVIVGVAWAVSITFGLIVIAAVIVDDDD